MKTSERTAELLQKASQQAHENAIIEVEQEIKKDPVKFPNVIYRYYTLNNLFNKSVEEEYIWFSKPNRF